MGCVNGNPLQVPHGRVRKHVVDLEVPVARCESIEEAGEQDCRLIELYRDVERVLLVVAVIVNSFVAAHAERLVAVATHRFQDALALHQEHIADVAGVLEARPSSGGPPGSDICGGSEQLSGGAARLANLFAGGAPSRFVVSPRKRRAGLEQHVIQVQMCEAAFGAPSHPMDATAPVFAAGSRVPPQTRRSPRTPAARPVGAGSRCPGAGWMGSGRR